MTRRPLENHERTDRRLRADDIERGREVTIEFDGRALRAYEGETIAAALMGSGRRILRYTSRARSPRGVYCGMGVCYDCLVVVDDRPNTRACMTAVVAGMRVRTQHLGKPDGDASR